MIQDGNPEAQKTLYNRYIKTIKDFLISKYSNYNDIDDDVSEILIKVFISFNQFDSTKSKFKSWVFTISKNYMIDKWRSSCSTITTSNYGENYTLGNTINASNSINCSYGTSVCNFENNSTLSFLSSQISSSDYTLLDMKYIQGYNYCEIGSEFNLTSTTISNRINYIKTKLKKNNSELVLD